IMNQNKNVNEIIKYVIMPNHIHMLVVIDDFWRSGATAPTTSLQQIVRNIKSFVTKWAKCSIWQKGFFDRVIRNQEECENIWNYIDTNPDKWYEDEYYR
ncbi:MAG: transposase, partial [Firmicutes bacterium]|nr:transposase [Bacillota bacterium]